jgi:REP element-mobilizing transposase RayT
MHYDPSRHHRRSIRLAGHDYRSPGTYFVTICVHGRARLLAQEGLIVQLNAAGLMVERWWRALAERFPSVTLGSFVVMPNHMHGVVTFNKSTVALGDLVGWFKTGTLHDYIEGVHSAGWLPFQQRLW